MNMQEAMKKAKETGLPQRVTKPSKKERFKVVLTDRITGEKTAFYTHSAGFHYNSKIVVGRVEYVRIMLDYPRTKQISRKRKNNGE